MKQTYVKYLIVAVLAGGFLFTSCRSARETTANYEVVGVKGSMITIDSVWDANPDKRAAEILKPYKDKVDAMMYEVIGTSEMIMDKGNPESLLSNLVAGVLQQAAVRVLGKPADMGLVIWEDCAISCRREISPLAKSSKSFLSRIRFVC